MLVLPDRQGYAFISVDNERGLLCVPEGAEANEDAARPLLAGLAAQARERGLAQLRLEVPPGNPLARLALLHGASQSFRPAGPGMAAITRWEPLLPPGYRVAGQGLAHGDRVLLPASRRALTELVVGYRGIDDLVLAPDCTVPGGDADLAMLRRDFPARFPRWSLEPFWF